MVPWWRKLLIGAALALLFTTTDGLFISRFEESSSLQHETQIFERGSFGVPQRPNQVHIVKYVRGADVLTVCFGSGRCFRHCNVPSYEFDSFRWSTIPDAYYSARVGARSNGYVC